MTWLVTLLLAIDLTGIKSEPALEKRSEMALQYADSEINAAREAYNNGDYEKSQAALREVSEAVDVSYQSLVATGKDPRKHSGHFKLAEKATRQILRRLENLRDLMTGVDRALIDPVTSKVSAVHESLLTGIMGKK
jgi:hypothetical protein